MTTELTTEAPADVASKRRKVTLWALAAAAAGVVSMVACRMLFGEGLGRTVGEWLMISAFATAGVAASVHDVRDRRLPDLITLPLAVGLLAGVWMLAIGSGDVAAGVTATGAGIVLAVLLFIGALIGGIGAGDLKLVLSVGLLAGWFGMLPPMFALLVSFLLPLPYAIIGVIRRSRGAQAPDVPFGPYLVAGTLIVVVFTAVA